MKKEEIVKLFTENKKTIKEIACIVSLSGARINMILQEELGKKYKKALEEVRKEKAKLYTKISECRYCGKRVEHTTTIQYFCDRKCYLLDCKKNKKQHIEKDKKEYRHNYYLRKKNEK